MKYSDVIAENADFEDLRVSCEHAKSVSLLAAVDSLLQWDEQTMLPAAAGEFRAEQAATLAALTHAQRTQQEQGERLEKLSDSSLAKNGPAVIRATIRLLHEDFQKQARVPEKACQRDCSHIN